MSKLALHGGTPVRTAPFPAWPVFGREEEEAVAAVIRSGHWGRLDGDRVREFEAAFAACQGARHGIATVTGSVALRLALLASGLEAGDEVIVPPYTFQATALAVVEANGTPIFADIEPGSLCLDPDAFRDAITPRTRAVIPVHLGGQPADLDRIREIAASHGITVIEDAAHAHGGTSGGRGLGSIGDLGCFSFQATKNLNSGEGGMILTGDDALAERCHAFQHCGRQRNGEWCDPPVAAGNYRLTELQAALLLAQLARLPEQTRTRNANGRYLGARLREIPGLRPQDPIGDADLHGYHLFCFRYSPEAFDGVPREAFLRAMAAEGIPVSPGYTVPLYRHPVFAAKAFGPYTGWRQARPDLDYAGVRCPVCERISTVEGCWLKQTQLLGPRTDMDDIAEAAAKIHRHRGDLR